MKTRLCAILFLLIILCPILMYAQDSTMTITKNRYFHFDVGLGYLSSNLNSLNNTLSSYGYNHHSENMANVSVSAGLFVKRMLMRVEASWFFTNQVDQPDNNLVSSFTGNVAGFGFGYLAIDKPVFRLYPYVGIHVVSAALAFHDNTPVSQMDDIINSSRRNSHVSFVGSTSLDLGFQVEQVIRLKASRWDCPQNPRFMTLGIRAGYYLPLNDVTGKHQGVELQGAPSFSLHGPYVKLIVGFGAKVRDLKWRK